jgi:hypothetical protein
MAHLLRRTPWGTVPAAMCLAVALGRAEGAIIHQSVTWHVPADRHGVLVDLEALDLVSGPEPAAAAAWHLRIFGDVRLEFAARDGDGTVAGLMRYSVDPSQSGPGSLPLDLVVGPFSDFGSGEASFGDAVGEWRFNSANHFGFTFVSRAGNVHYGWARMDIGADAGTRTIVEIAWQDTPGVGIQVGHVPAAGPLVLLGIAALVGGPRRTRSAVDARLPAAPLPCARDAGGVRR